MSSPKPPSFPPASHHYQPMAGKGESKTVATTSAMTPPATLPAVNSPIPATKASMEDMATFVQPLAMIPAEGNSGGPVGATLRSTDLPGRPTRGGDIHRPAPLHVPPRLSRLQDPGHVRIVPMVGRPRKLRPRRGRSFSSSSRMERQQDYLHPLRSHGLLP